MITLRVTDEMIQDWQQHHGRCPLAMAFQRAQIQGIHPFSVDNATPGTGDIIYKSSVDDHWYRIYPIPQDTQPVIAFIHAVDHCTKLPRKRVYRYGEPQLAYPY